MKEILHTTVNGYENIPRVTLKIYRNTLRNKRLPIVMQIATGCWDQGIYPNDNVAGLRLTQDNIDELIKTLVNVRVELENGSKK